MKASLRRRVVALLGLARHRQSAIDALRARFTVAVPYLDADAPYSRTVERTGF